MAQQPELWAALFPVIDLFESTGDPFSRQTMTRRVSFEIAETIA